MGGVGGPLWVGGGWGWVGNHAPTRRGPKSRPRGALVRPWEGPGKNHAWSVKIGPREKSHAGGVTFSVVSFFPEKREDAGFSFSSRGSASIPK